MSTPERWTTCRRHGGSWFEGGKLPPYCALSPDSCDRVTYVLEAAHEAALVEARTQAARDEREKIGLRLTVAEARLALGWESLVEQEFGTSNTSASPEEAALVERLAVWVRSGDTDA